MGSLQLWDLKEQRIIGEGSLEPVLQGLPPHVTGARLIDASHTDAIRCKLLIDASHYHSEGSLNQCVRGRAVVSMRLSRCGLPLAILSNSTAYALHLGMKTWMCVADSSFSYSSYASILTSGSPSAGLEQSHRYLHSDFHSLYQDG